MNAFKVRKCCVCGLTNREISLHRFPKPGKPTSVLRAPVWAEYCFPLEDWTAMERLQKLYTSQKMLCSRHFDDTSYTDSTRQRLNIFAIPTQSMHVLQRIRREQENIIEVVHNNLTREEAEPQVHNEVEHRREQNIIEVVHNNLTREEAEPQVHNEVEHRREQNIIEVVHNNLTREEAEPQVAITPSRRGKRNILKEIDFLKVSQMTPRKQKLYKRCRRNAQEITRLRGKARALRKRADVNILKMLSEDESICNATKMTKSFSVMLKGQLNNTPRKSNGRRWSVDDKVLALSIYKKSAACYRLLRRLFCLPAQGTLRLMLNQIPMVCGINQQIFSHLAGTMSDKGKEDNLCVLLFDEMSIRKNLAYNSKLNQIDGFEDHGAQGRSARIASNALVFMLVGVRKKWKQPIAYYFSGDNVTSDRLSVLIKEVIRQCFQAGVNVIATVCDLDGVNIKAINKLGSSLDKPYFEIDGHEVVTILDPPHLLKCFRNLFQKYNIEYTQDVQNNGQNVRGVAEWKHVEEFYKVDSQNSNFVFAPVLSRHHLQPNCQQKMKVKLAAQVLSHSVAAGMFAKIAQGEIPAGATATATLITKIDQLFDSLNADTPDLKRGKKYSTNLTLKRSYISEYWRDMKIVIKNIRYIGSRACPPSQDGWIRTLNAVERVWHNLKVININSLSTRRLNQDPLENLFGCIRSNCGSNPNPTISQFVAGLKTSLLSNLISNNNKRNCEDDNNEILDDLKRFFVINDEMKLSDLCTEESEALVKSTANVDFGNFDGTAEAQACAYVCGFIIKKRAVDCTQCKSAMIDDEVSINHTFTEFKEYNDKSKSLHYANKNFIYCVELCASEVNQFLSTNAHSPDIKNEITRLLKLNIDFDWLLVCKDHYTSNINYVIESVFQICIKRFCVLSNRKFVEEASRKVIKRKLNILQNV